ncbi:MAG: ABC transporter permease [Anaerolineaceae bacterium]|nr:ABC transporter permease [Anaerolineaceae bacterium]
MKFLLRRVFFAVITLFVISVILYGIIYLTPVDVRISLFMPANFSPRMTEEAIARYQDMIAEKNHLYDSFFVQYYYWAKHFVENQWGYSPSLHQFILPAIIANSPVTIELTFCSLLLLIPLTLASGIRAAVNKDKFNDFLIRAFSIIAAHIPLFVMAYILLAIFYVGLKWATLSSLDIVWLEKTAGYHSYTGMNILDGLLNKRPDVSLMALRRLALPVLTITFSQWAFLTRITRNATIEEMQKDYISGAKARGASPRRIIMTHVLRNTMSVFLSNTAMSASTVVTGVFVVERIFVIPGVSEILFRHGSFVPDAAAVIGFTFYCVIMVLTIMLILDVINAAVNPLIGLEVTGSSDVE